MADTAYIIDVASSMPEGGTTTAQLDALSASLVAAGADAELLETSLLQVNAELRAAKEATRAANDALAEGNTKYAELEAAAIKTAKAAERAAEKGKLDPLMSKAAYDAAQALEAEEAALGKLEAAAASAAKAERDLVNLQSNLRSVVGAGTRALDKQSAAVAAAASQKAALDKQSAAASAAAAKKSVREAEGMVPLVKQFNDLGDAMSTSSGRAILMAGAAVGAATAIAAVTVAALAGTVALAGWAIGLADAKREAALTDEAAAALHPEVAALSQDFANISDDLGATNADMRKWVGQLEGAKVAAEDMPAALRAVAVADAALGKGEGIGAFLDDMRKTKRAAGDVAAEFSSKLGGVAAKRMMGLDAQSARLKKNVSNLFGGMNIDPALEAMRVLTDLFDKGTASGEAMKFLFEEIFQPLINQATNAAYVVEAFVLGFLIGLTKLYIAVKPAIKAVADLLGFEDTSLTDVLNLAKNAGEIAAFVFVGFVAVLGLLAAAVGSVVAVGAVFTAGVYSAIAAVVSLGASLVSGVIGAIQAVRGFLAGVDLGEIGKNLMLGLANGITGGASSVVSAIVGVAKNAIQSAKSALGIASPSKVFAEIGGYTAEGFAVGVDDGTADAQAAMAAMVEPPALGALSPYAGLAGGSPASDGPAPAGAPGAASGSVSVTIQSLVIGPGVDRAQAQQAADAFAERFTQLLEGDAAAIAGAA